MSLVNQTLQNPESVDKLQLMINEFQMLPLGNLVIAFILFFIGGYLLFSSLYAAIGAAVDNETDTQQFMLPCDFTVNLSDLCRNVYGDRRPARHHLYRIFIYSIYVSRSDADANSVWCSCMATTRISFDPYSYVYFYSMVCSKNLPCWNPNAWQKTNV